jgi:hypothetical protein
MKVTMRRVKMLKGGKCGKGAKLRRTGKSHRKGCWINAKGKKK